MKIFDPHIHMFSRTTEDYSHMELARVRAVLEPAFWLGQPRTQPGSFRDYFSHLLEFEPTRAAQYQIAHHAAIAVNPKEANDEGLTREVLSFISEYIEHPQCVCVGEIGFDSMTKAEEFAIQEHLELAKKHDLPVLVHLPHVDKLEGTERTLAVIRESGIPEERVLVDHNTEETIALVKDGSGCWAGHSIYTRTKLTPARAADILERFGSERMLINSAADWGVSDPLLIPKTVIELEHRGWEQDKILRVVWDNPVEFFSQSGKLKLPT